MKKLLVVCFVLMLALCLYGCAESNGGDETPENGQQQGPPAGGAGTVLEALVDHFKSEGLKVEDVHAKAYELIGAIDGIGLEVEGAAIELYLYDLDTADEETRQHVADFVDQGRYIMNGDIALFGLGFGFTDQEAKAKIEAAFESF